MDREVFAVSRLENGFDGRGNVERLKLTVQSWAFDIQCSLRVFIDKAPDVVATVGLNVRDQLFLLQVQRDVRHRAVDVDAIARTDAAEAAGDVDGAADVVVAYLEVTGESKADARAE